MAETSDDSDLGEEKLTRLFKKCATLEEASELYRRTRNFVFAYQLFAARITDISKINISRNQNVEFSEVILQPGAWYSLVAITARHSKKYNVWAGNFKIEVKQLPIHGVDSVIPILLALFEDIFRNIRTYVPNRDDLISVSLESSQLAHPIQLKLAQQDSVNAEMFLYLIANVLTSKSEFSLNLPLFINIIRIPKAPVGHGGRPFRDWRKAQRFAGVTVVRNNDDLCFGRALAIALAHASGLRKRDYKKWSKLCDGRYSIQRVEAEKLYHQANVQLGPVSYAQYGAFQKALLPDYQLIVFQNPSPDGMLYTGQNADKKLYLLLYRHHYSVITNLVRFFGKRKQCLHCYKMFNCAENEHSCTKTCYVCHRANCALQDGASIYCEQCNRVFSNPECFAYHRSIIKTHNMTECSLRYKCSDCQSTVRVTKPRSTSNPEHQCGEYYCRSCKLVVESNHRCFIQRYTNHPKTNRSFLYCDFETDISGSSHVPVAAVAVNDQGEAVRFFGCNAGTKFCQWLFCSKHKNYIIIFHNLMGYDGNFIMQYLQNEGIWPSVIMRGLKFLQIYLPQHRIILRDSLAFLPMSLSSMPKAFGFSGAKGRFPFLFTSQSNFNYIGPIPDEKYYLVSQMSRSEYRDFRTWYDEEKQSKKMWSFYREILKYCENDCQVLKEACQRFCTDMVLLTGFNPLIESVSLPSFVNLVYRARFMSENSIQFFTPSDLQTYRTYSFESLEWLEYLMVTRQCFIQHARNNPDGEKRIGRYLVDGFLEQSKEVLEYHGCYFHGCPSCYARTAKAFGNQTMDQLYNHTLSKQNFLQMNGYKYTSIWSCQWKRMKNDTQVKHIVGASLHIEPMNIRDALYGGRTEAFRLLAQPDLTRNEYISYLDKNSLYPAVCKQKEYPIGLPLKLFPISPSIENFFGIAHVKILPPKRLPLPVLPQRIKNKCMFVLCWRCATEATSSQYVDCTHTDTDRCFKGVYTTPELHLAAACGYQILNVYEVWHYPQKGDLFSQYIALFMAEKVAASGYPEHCVTDTEKQQYLHELAVRDQVFVDPAKVENNPTRRLLSKLMLNTLWGKLAIKENRPRFEYVRENKRFNELFYSGNFDVSYVNIVTEDVLQVQSTTSCDLDSTDLNANVIVASFVTSYARIELYQAMQFIGIERLLYVDTDCVIALEGPGLPSLSIGEGLGEFKSEIGTDRITLFVCGGPKMYAYCTRDGAAVFKAKGITINQGNIQLFNPETLKQMVLNPSIVHKILNPYKIFRLKGTWELETRHQSKVLRFTFDKRLVTGDDYRTVPFGYHFI